MRRKFQADQRGRVTKMGMHMGGGGGHMHGMADEEDEKRVRNVPDRVLAIRLLKYVFRYRQNTALMVLTVLANSLLSLAPPLLIGIALDAANPEKVLNNTIFMYAIIGFVVVNILTFASQAVQSYLVQFLFGRMEYDIRKDMFQHMQRLSLRYYSDKEVGSIISRPTNDVDKIFGADQQRSCSSILRSCYSNWNNCNNVQYER